MPKFCNNGHQMDDSWTDCPYCVKTGYRASEAAIGDKTRPEVEVRSSEERANSVPDSFDPGKTVPLSKIKRTPVVGWLVALNGAQRGEDFRLREGKNGLGSATGSEIAVHDPAVSARHAIISYRDGKFAIADLDSTNGTFLNDDTEPVIRGELKDNDVIHVGETALKFKCL
jgi:hypothetical protein